MERNNYILFDKLKRIQKFGEFTGSIISKSKDEFNSIIFSDNMRISEDKGIQISEGLMVGFEQENNKKVAFSRKITVNWESPDESKLEYSVKIPEEIMEQYDEGQFGDAFPFTINLLHTAGLFLNDTSHSIDHLDFFKGEILKNPVSVIFNGITIADRVVIDHRGDPVFYDCLIVGRDQNDDLSISYEPLVNIDDKVVEHIIILGIEELKL